MLLTEVTSGWHCAAGYLHTAPVGLGVLPNPHAVQRHNCCGNIVCVLLDQGLCVGSPAALLLLLLMPVCCDTEAPDCKASLLVAPDCSSCILLTKVPVQNQTRGHSVSLQHCCNCTLPSS